MTQKLADLMERLAGLHGHIAGDVFPNGATLSCKKCGLSVRASCSDCAHYLASGWPKCCGATMECKP